jgi:hypothetical protein
MSHLLHFIIHAKFSLSSYKVIKAKRDKISEVPYVTKSVKEEEEKVGRENKKKKIPAQLIAALAMSCQTLAFSSDSESNAECWRESLYSQSFIEVRT